MKISRTMLGAAQCFRDPRRRATSPLFAITITTTTSATNAAIISSNAPLPPSGLTPNNFSIQSTTIPPVTPIHHKLTCCQG